MLKRADILEELEYPIGRGIKKKNKRDRLDYLNLLVLRSSIIQASSEIEKQGFQGRVGTKVNQGVDTNEGSDEIERFTG
ncbi:25668_t:CDS:2 [Gigaspora margarita]|uniref:25668_t:CDS:1 n=1 Tax=Gigaspora margarita TaxID=4874 RepID=A0ABN7UEZ8_GIGMA|nr:25668_t:CDS:2 [Gigaspora margarita]